VKLLFAVQRLGEEGGMERFLDIVLPALVARGVELRVIARTIDAMPTGFSAQRVPWADEHDAPDAAAADAVRDVCARFSPDAVIAQNVMDAGVVEALRSAPQLTYHLCDHRPFCPNGDRLFPRTGQICGERLGTACAVHALTDGCAYGPRPRTITLIQQRRRMRDAIAAADRVMVDSSFMVDEALSNGVPHNRLVEIADPLADDDYADCPAPASPVVAFAGRFVPQKGLVSLVRAIGTIDADHRPKLIAIGDGPERALIVKEAARLGVTIEAPGQAGITGVRAAIDAASVVAFPSLWAEPFGRVGIEAFARGRPVVAYDVGGVRSWLDNERNGLVVSRGDEALLGAAIARVLDDESLRVRLSAQAVADAQRRRLGPFLDRLLEITSLRSSAV
jgi:glycosyltransferase involved in cell wall biosynthesis